jgi:hypothetical protein
MLASMSFALVLWCGAAAPMHGQEDVLIINRDERTDNSARTERPADDAALAERQTDETAANVLPADEWERVDAAVDRALTWLAATQQPDGSFPTLEMGQPGVTSLCVMAFMAHGHLPGEGQHGERLERAVDFVLDSQSENGLLSRVGAEGPHINRNVPHEIGEAAAYNHAIAALMLSEFYGMSQSERSDRVQKVIAAALATSLEMQRWPKSPAGDRGGWRYVGRPVYGTDSDLSVTGWELMFLRSARNAGFNVPKESIDDAVAYIRRCFHDNYGTFLYMQGKGNQDLRSRAMAGAGILALAHAGAHNTPEAKRSADWLLQYDFNEYNDIERFTQSWPIDRYHYSLFNSCQGMYQMGGRYWEQFFPRTVRTLLANQQRDGSWQAERHQNDAKFGSAYTTALVVLSLGAPNQILPVFQR